MAGWLTHSAANKRLSWRVRASTSSAYITFHADKRAFPPASLFSSDNPNADGPFVGVPAENFDLVTEHMIVSLFFDYVVSLFFDYEEDTHVHTLSYIHIYTHMRKCVLLVRL